MFRFLIVAAALTATTLAPAAFAQSTIDQTRPLDAGGRIDIENVKGRIEVRAWERDEVKISGTLGEGVEKLVVEGDRQHLVVRVQYPRNSGWGGRQAGSTDLRLTVPVRAELDIESVSADVDVSGVAPRQLSIDTVSGDVIAIGAPGKATIEAVSGSLNLTLNSADVAAETVSGDIRLNGRLNGDISAETVSGSILVAVNGERVSELTASTVSGNANISTALATDGKIKMESVSGNLTLRLPSDVSAQVRGESFSGRLRATGVTIEKRRGPGSSFQTRYGSGDGDISMTTFSGNAEVRVE